jgi:GNAT superfamily N-acetyltransferase
VASSPEYKFEPLADHDRSAFHCGVPELDRYLHLQASQDMRRKVAAPFVMVDRLRKIVGYYTLSAYAIQMNDVPPDLAKKLPKYPLLPATLLGRLAVHEERRGQKLGSLLLMDALHRAWKNTSEVASVGVIAEALDDKAKAFYRHHEFVPVPDHPKKMFLAMTTIVKAFPSR